MSLCKRYDAMCERKLENESLSITFLERDLGLSSTPSYRLYFRSFFGG